MFHLQNHLILLPLTAYALILLAVCEALSLRPASRRIFLDRSVLGATGFMLGGWTSVPLSADANPVSVSKTNLEWNTPFAFLSGYRNKPSIAKASSIDAEAEIPLNENMLTSQDTKALNVQMGEKSRLTIRSKLPDPSFGVDEENSSDESSDGESSDSDAASSDSDDDGSEDSDEDRPTPQRFFHQIRSAARKTKRKILQRKRT